MPDPKTCCRCKQAKPLGAFHLSRRAVDGRDPRCRDCRKQDTARAPKDPQRTRNHGLVRLYGITATEYEELHAAQAGVCAICKEPETLTRNGVLRNLCVDHDHITGQVRGLLCASCNLAVGKFKDKPDLMLSAADYLAAAVVERVG